MTCIAVQLPKTIAGHHQRRQTGFAASNQKRRISRARELGSARPFASGRSGRHGRCRTATRKPAPNAGADYLTPQSCRAEPNKHP